MVDDFKMFSAWALGVITTIVLWALSDSLSPRIWALTLGLFILLVLAAFWKMLGDVCTELIQFFMGALEARRERIERQHIEKIMAEREGSR